MKYLISGIVTAMGFVLGLILAGVGGLSAKTLVQFDFKSENPKKLEKYWIETGLKSEDITQLISNNKCYSSEFYKNACLNAVLENSLRFNYKLSAEDGTLIKLNSADKLDERSEKELLSMYSKRNISVDFDRILDQLINLEKPTGRPVLVSQIINSFLSVYFDPHTYIIPTNFYDEVGSKIERSKFFVGIAYEKLNSEFYIRKISKNSDAEIAGLKPNDKIISINSVKLAGVPYINLSSILKNENNNFLEFVILRNNEILNINLKRTFRQLSHVQYNVLTTQKNYGLITLSKFNRGACGEVSEKLKEVNKNNMEGLILDLRDNPGGQLNEASCIAGLFLGKDKKAYYIEYFDQAKPNEVILTSSEQLYKGPLVVIVNSASASASELLAGGLQEYKRALVIGEKTFGKGTFQEAEEWLFNSKVSLYKTQGLYLLPSRNSTQLDGIKPDIELHAEEFPVKRERDAFFNPIKLKFRRYEKLKKTELVNNFVFKNCKTDKLISRDDSYLEIGLHYLNCVEAIDKLANGNTGKSAADSF